MNWALSGLVYSSCFVLTTPSWLLFSSLYKCCVLTPSGSCFPADIEAQILEIQGMKASLVEEGEQGVGLVSTGFYDQEIYGGNDSRFAGYVTSIAANEQEDVSIRLPVK